ncbi:GerAB/ArcD/ProY family transporter [Lederbergia panacisoli]|uniref:GerAB/ArcD/ProY family transporter n=1 Tax=Lederbergia panacisoli TaxID=1255251 RepID=UPI00214ACCB4|nr:GerAB/ArcD/ProY family transporter [Lederbergia panacisoli]MCR2821563.1 GerAB/ArcD/ProY family transporter [Lederbergia panacisoli]
MNRYMYYLIYINMFANMVVSVPKILLGERKDGAIISMVLAVIAGMFVIYVFLWFFNKFPGKDYPELAKKYLSKWIHAPILLLFALVWFTAGLNALITYTFMLKRFLTPDMSVVWIASTFLIFISFGILMHTKSILYTIEAILIISSPLIIFLIAKAFLGPDFEWDFVRVAVTYIYRLPSYSAFTASFYVFLGIANLVIFNRAWSTRPIQSSIKHVFLMGLAGIMILFTIYVVPMGMNGFERIDHLVYPAITTSDTLRMKYGVMERVLYLFLLFYLAVTFLNLLLHWHVTVEILKSLFWIKKFKWKENNLTPFIFIIIFWLIALTTATSLSEYQLFEYTIYFFYCLPFLTMILILSFWIIKRRAKI